MIQSSGCVLSALSHPRLPLEKEHIVSGQPNGHRSSGVRRAAVSHVGAALPFVLVYRILVL